MTAVVYYNPQSMLVSFPINTGVFNVDIASLSACQRAILDISYNMGTLDFPDVVTLSPWAF